MAEVKLRAGAIEWRELDGDLVAFDLDATEYIAVNRTGASIWPLLVDGATRAQLADRLVSTYGIDRDAAERDVEAFLSALSERNVLDTE